MAQLNDLLVMGQSTLLGPVKIDSIIDKNGSNGATNSSTIDKVLKSDDNGKIYWGSADNVTFSQSLTSGTKIGTITINGTATNLYCQTNTNTTYTFTNGTNGFTVTPAGGNAQTVTVTPSITNNITGSGARTSGYIDKFSGANTITNGPAIGTSTTTYLRNDGQWATPTDNNTTYTFTGGTNKFTVTTSDGTTQNVTITPRITNNITGTGTSGYIASFNGANSITSSGYKLFTYSTTSPDCWGVIPYIDTSGYTKIGKYIQFHTSDTATSAACTITGTTDYISSSKQVQAPSFYATSDARLKTNIQPHTYDVSKSILDLPIYKFDFIEGSKNQIGCLAQDLQKICPEIVASDENGFLSIQESKNVYLLIDEVKKLKSQIQQLQKEV